MYLLDKYLKKNMILTPPKNAPIWFIPAFVIFDTRMISIYARTFMIDLKQQDKSASNPWLPVGFTFDIFRAPV